MAKDKPLLEPKGCAAAGGRPGGIAVSADAARLLVFHDETARVTALDAVRLSELGHDVLGGGPAPRRFRLGRRDDLFYCAAPESGVAVFDALRLRFSEPLPCQGVPVDLCFSSDGERAFLAVEDAAGGFLERRLGAALDPWDAVRLDGWPVPGSLAYSARTGLVALLLRRPSGDVDLCLWRSDPFEPLLTAPAGDAAEALAFSPQEDLLFVSRPERQEVTGISLADGKVSRRIVMLGCARQLAATPAGAGVWALSEGLAHLVRVDLPLGAGPAPVRLEGLDAARNRLRFSPEGRLGILPLAGSGRLLLLDARAEAKGADSVADLLDTGRPLVDAAWSPLGDAVYAAGEDGSVLSFEVDRGAWEIHDAERDTALPVYARAAAKYPLFPP